MNSWAAIPFLRVLLPFLLGIVCSIVFDLAILTLAVAVALAVAPLLILTQTKKLPFKFRWLFGVIFNVCIFFSGFAICELKKEEKSPTNFVNHCKEKKTVMAMVNEPLQNGKKSLKTVLKIIAVKIGDNWKETEGKVLSYFYPDSLSKGLEFGDLLLINENFAEIRPPLNPEEFDYKDYLANKQIYRQVYIKSGKFKVIANGNGNALLDFAYHCRIKLVNVFLMHDIGDQEFAVASALILGYEDELNRDIIQSYSITGALHILSVSGLHVAIVFLMLNNLFFFMNKFKHGKIIKAIALVLMLSFYALITGLSPSVMRAVAMFGLIIIAKAMSRYTNVYNTLAVSAFVLLLFNPFLIMDVGFQLSYLAVAGIVLLYDGFSNLWYPRSRLMNQAWSICCMSMAAQIATFPLGLLYFHQFPNYFLFSNLLVVPLSSLVLIIGITLLIVSPFSYLAGFVAKILSFLVWLLNTVVGIFGKLPYATIDGISVLKQEVFLLYLMIGALVTFFYIKNPKYLLAFLVFSLVLILLQFAESLEQRSQEKLIIYSIPKHTAIDFVTGKTTVFLADSALNFDEGKMSFHIQPNRWKIGIGHFQLILKDKTQIYTNQNLFYKSGFIQFYHKTLMIPGNFSFRDKYKKIKVDYVLLTNTCKLSLKMLKQCFDFNLLILDGSLSNFSRKKIITACRQDHILFYDLLEEGALEIGIK